MSRVLESAKGVGYSTCLSIEMRRGEKAVVFPVGSHRSTRSRAAGAESIAFSGPIPCQPLKC